MKAKDYIRARILKDTLHEHQLCTADRAIWRAFFRGLEDEFNCARQPIAHTSEHFSNAH